MRALEAHNSAKKKYPGRQQWYIESGSLPLGVLQVRLANYLDSRSAPDADGSLDPKVRKMVRDQAEVHAEPLGQRPAWAFERGEDLSSPEGDDVCQRIPGPCFFLATTPSTVTVQYPCLCENHHARFMVAPCLNLCLHLVVSMPCVPLLCLYYAHVSNCE